MHIQRWKNHIQISGTITGGVETIKSGGWVVAHTFNPNTW